METHESHNNICHFLMYYTVLVYTYLVEETYVILGFLFVAPHAHTHTLWPLECVLVWTVVECGANLNELSLHLI